MRRSVIGVAAAAAIASLGGCSGADRPGTHATASAATTPSAAAPTPTGVVAVGVDEYAKDACNRVAKASRAAGELDPAEMLSIGQTAVKSSYIEVNVRGMLLVENTKRAIAAKGGKDEAFHREEMVAKAIQMTQVCEYASIIPRQDGDVHPVQL